MIKIKVFSYKWTLGTNTMVLLKEPLSPKNVINCQTESTRSFKMALSVLLYCNSFLPNFPQYVISPLDNTSK